MMSSVLIREENTSRKIKKEFSYIFKIEQGGIHTIIVSAKTKSWFQNIRKLTSFFSDANLAIKINGVGFPKLSGEKGEFDGEASWNGNKLKGLRQVNLFVVYLERGEQNLQFISKGLPLLELIEVYKIEKNRIFIDPSRYLIEDGNRRPWFNVLTNKIGIVSISAKAIASVGKDDNDLQIRINGLREQNNESKSHKYWFWCGRVLRGQSKIFKRTLALKPGFNYIEFWADGVPVFNDLNIHVTMSNRIPSLDVPEWTGNFYDDSEEMILARLIFGEARGQGEEARVWAAKVVLNRVESKGWVVATIHDVILQKGQFDAFKEEDKNFKFVKNPLLDISQRGSWIECFNIAKGIINGGIKNPTKATHFHSHIETEAIEWFEQNIIPNGKFLKKIGNLYFYWSPN